MVKTPDTTISKCLTAGIWISSVFSIIVEYKLSFGALGHLGLRIRTGSIIMGLLIILESIIKINHKEKIIKEL